MTAPPTIESPAVPPSAADPGATSPAAEPRPAQLSLEKENGATAPTPNEDRARVALHFFMLSFAAGCLLLPPMQWVSAGIAFTISGVLYLRYVRLTNEAKAKAKKPPTPAPDAADSAP